MRRRSIGCEAIPTKPTSGDCFVVPPRNDKKIVSLCPPRNGRYYFDKLSLTRIRHCEHQCDEEALDAKQSSPNILQEIASSFLLAMTERNALEGIGFPVDTHYPQLTTHH
jgi:hypothetical protein